MPTIPGLGYNHLPEIIAALPQIASAIVRKHALEVEAAAKGRVAVDTGAAKNSIYTVGAGVDGSGAGLAAAGQDALPPVAAPTSPTQALVCVGVLYGIYLELGTRHMSAQPFMAPATEDVRPRWDAAWLALEARLREVLP